MPKWFQCSSPLCYIAFNIDFKHCLGTHTGLNIEYRFVLPKSMNFYHYMTLLSLQRWYQVLCVALLSRPIHISIMHGFIDHVLWRKLILTEYFKINRWQWGKIVRKSREQDPLHVWWYPLRQQAISSHYYVRCLSSLKTAKYAASVHYIVREKTCTWIDYVLFLRSYIISD